MIDWVTAIAEADEDEIRDVMALVLDRYRELYPYEELETFWVDYGRTVHEQIDSRIKQLERLKRRIGPVLLAPSKRRLDDLTPPTWR